VITTVLDSVTGQLGKRFLLNAFFPILLFSLLAAAVVTPGGEDLSASVAAYEGQSSAAKALIVIGWAAVVLVAANLLANASISIIRLFEGYALPQRVMRHGRSYWYKKAVAAMKDKEPGREWRYPLPAPGAGFSYEDVAPTRLGNVLRSGEMYPQARYGAPALRVWPRLYHLLPVELRTSFEEAQNAMEFLLVVAFLSGLFGPLATVYLMCVEAPTGWVMAALVGSAVVAYTAYLGALAPAGLYADNIRAAFDAHRMRVLEALQVPRPATVAEERRTWAQVISRLDRGVGQPGRYVPAP
jgi:hypothetical protein